MSRTNASLSLAITALAIIANWPQEVSSTKASIEQAGFPQVFAIWKGERLESFDIGAMLIDVALPLVAVIVLCVGAELRKRVSHRPREKQPVHQ